MRHAYQQGVIKSDGNTVGLEKDIGICLGQAIASHDL